MTVILSWIVEGPVAVCGVCDAELPDVSAILKPSEMLVCLPCVSLIRRTQPPAGTPTDLN